MAKTPTPEQLKALQKYARIEGRSWKASLRLAWMDGDYGVHGDISNFLQQLRNTFGPTWLTKFKLPAVAEMQMVELATEIQALCAGVGTMTPGEARFDIAEKAEQLANLVLAMKGVSR